MGSDINSWDFLEITGISLELSYQIQKHIFDEMKQHISIWKEKQNILRHIVTLVGGVTYATFGTFAGVTGLTNMNH